MTNPAFLGGCCALLGYQSWLNRRERSGPVYVGANLAAAGAVLAAGRRAGLGWADMGLDPSGVGPGLRWGAGAATAIAAAWGVAAASPRLRPRLADRRLAHLDAAGVAALALLRIPLGTVVLEEVAFRGVLPAMAAGPRKPWRGALVSSLVFGLWHVAPTRNAVRSNEPGADRQTERRIIAAAVALTSTAGLVLCELRRCGGGLLAPALAHTASNSLGALAGWWACRSRGHPLHMGQ